MHTHTHIPTHRPLRVEYTLECEKHRSRIARWSDPVSSVDAWDWHHHSSMALAVL